ncbi:MAG: hypothetical protein J2P17_05905 [Mycobacterium sp.]|nr:hypothetical protein [Mycobacterium sp.]
MASTDKFRSTDRYAVGRHHPIHAVTLERPRVTHTGTANEATTTHRRGPEPAPAKPQTRSEYIEHVLAQIKAPK